jgi:hypothetical protein
MLGGKNTQKLYNVGPKNNISTLSCFFTVKSEFNIIFFNVADKTSAKDYLMQQPTDGAILQRPNYIG